MDAKTEKDNLIEGETGSWEVVIGMITAANGKKDRWKSCLFTRIFDRGLSDEW